jgi:heparanase 1
MTKFRLPFAAASACALAATGCVSAAQHTTGSGPLASLTQIEETSPRFQSYNVEMVEVTGGEFWAPYGGPADEVYRMRPAIDLDNERLRALANHLSPAYMRISGTWANKTYLPAEGENITEVPAGYGGILTRDQWREAVEFSKAVDAPILLSFAVGPGARDENGVWTTEQAQRMVDLTREIGGNIAAVEFFNEPNAAFLSSLPQNYSAQDYIRDFRIFHEWARRELPDAKIFGMGGVNEGAGNKAPVAMRAISIVFSKDVMPVTAGMLDGVSYHHYGTISQRCGGRSSMEPAKLEDALTAEWLDRPIRDNRYYTDLRDRYEPGDPIWITETAQAACGGSPWAKTFADSFRYIGQMGAHAQMGVDVIFHNTLAASDYALLDDDSFDPRPNYWAAVLWQRLMGENVLTSPPSPSAELRIYAHCLKDKSGGVALAAVNLGAAPQSFATGPKAQAWHLTAPELTAETVMVNGRTPEAAPDGSLSGLDPVYAVDKVTIGGRSIAFVAVPDAGNPACR